MCKLSMIKLNTAKHMTISLRQTQNVFALLVKLHFKCMIIMFNLIVAKVMVFIIITIDNDPRFQNMQHITKLQRPSP